MKASKARWRPGSGWQIAEPNPDAQLVLYFGAREALAGPHWLEQLQALYPQAQLMGCSAGSHIDDDEIVEDGISAVALYFAASRCRTFSMTITDPDQSFERGEAIGAALSADDLAGIFVLSDGLSVNGTELTYGMSHKIAQGVPVMGGMAADGTLFSETLVGLGGAPERGRIAAVGFYGKAISLRTGSAGGWSEFGPRRQITKAQGDVLFNLDDEPALDLYKRYLGPEDSVRLPASALFFPLKVFDPRRPEHAMVRTVLAVDHDLGTVTFSGNVPQGWSAQLMRGTVERLADGAAEAAIQVQPVQQTLDANTLVLMVSCVGRFMLMGQRTIDEIDAVSAALGDAPVRIGFYSYGEICPHQVSGRSEMHNQTMTITALAEVPTA